MWMIPSMPTTSNRQNGLYAREALICDVLGITLEDIKADKTII